MSGETSITITGNLTNEPELRKTTAGSAVANFTVASTPRAFDPATREWRDGETLFLRATVWREMADHVAASLTKGSRVVATGVLKPRSYETKAGEKRTLIELEVEEIGLSLKYAPAPHELTKNEPTTAQPTKAAEPAGAETWSGAPSGEDPDAAAAAAARAERRSREFTISPRVYTGDDVWFGKDANPSGRVELPATPAAPEW
jgi:single-strand DNA-binding protein